MGVEGPKEKEKGKKVIRKEGCFFFHRVVFEKKKIKSNFIKHQTLETQRGVGWRGMKRGARSWGWNGKKGVMGMIWFGGRVGRVEKWWEKGEN